MTELSDVVVTFTDGEVKTYRITASPRIGGYLAANAGQSGVLSLFNGTESWGIPMHAVRDWAIKSVAPEPAPPKPRKTRVKK